MHLCLIGPLNHSNKQSVILCLVVRWKLVRERHQSIQFIIFFKKNFCDAKHLVILRITRDVFLNLFFFSLDSKGSCNQKWMSTNVKITTRGDNTGKIIFICQKKKKRISIHICWTRLLWWQKQTPCGFLVMEIVRRQCHLEGREQPASEDAQKYFFVFFAYSKLTKPIFMDHSSDVEHM